MARKKPTTAKKPTAKAAAKDPCAAYLSSKTLKAHMADKPAVEDPCYSQWKSHASWLAAQEGVRLGPM